MEHAHELPDSERLLALLREQRDLYRKLRALSDRQRGLISGDEPDRLLNILRDRQTLVAGLVRLNDQLAPYRRDWESIHARLPDNTRDEASALLSEINEILQGILRIDQEDGALLSARRQAVARSLSDVSGGRTANAAYAQQARRTDSAAAADLTG